MSHPETPDGHDEHNVISLAEAAARRQANPASAPRAGQRTPMINLPPVTKFMILGLIAVHILTDVILSAPQQYWVFAHFGFIPDRYTGDIPFSWPALAGPLTFTFLHGGWTHIILNTFMLMAFGAGVEKWIGGKRLFAFFMLCNLAAALAQFALDPSSTAPVIGASGGLSGLFAAVLIMMQKQGGMGAGTRFGILPFVALWIGISILFGMMGGPDGSDVAWAAHIGGFLAGFAILKPLMKTRFLD